MPRVRDVLYRFRPAGAPGAASTAGVPVDRSADLAAELEPVFGLLAGTEQECRDVVARAERDAATAAARDAERARDLLAAARGRVDAERAAVVAELRQRDQAGRAAVLADAEREAVDLRQRAAERIPSYVDDVVAAVSALLAEQPVPGRAVGAR